MLYYLIRPFARITFKLLFRNIRFEGLDRIPKGVPIIFATNHPSAFLEPCLMACWMPMPLSFIVRGDLFKKKLVRLLLGSLNLIPMFRVKDGGFNVVKNNFESIRYVVEYLNKDKCLMILAEGHITAERRLAKMKKGTARLAFGALNEKPDSGLVIIPVGADFDDQTRFGTDVHFTIGEAIKVEDYYDEYLEHNNRGITKITNLLYERLEACLIQIPNKKDEELSEKALAFYNSQHPVGSGEEFDIRNKEEKKLTRVISNMTEESKVAFNGKLDDYNALLEKSGLRKTRYSESNKVNWGVLVFHALLFPFGLANATYIYFSKFVNNRIPIVYEYITSIFFASAMFTGIIFYSLLISFLGLKSVTGIFIVIAIALFGYLFGRNRFAFAEEINKIRFKRLKKEAQDLILQQQDQLNLQLVAQTELK